MTDDLIARLKAAHEAPGPWDYTLVPDKDADLIALVRNSLPEIIAALEERERLRAVVEAAQAYRERVEAEAAKIEPWNAPELDGGIRAALDALEKKG